ncbi:DNA-processing protein DprA [Actinomycetospora soli]|uniref:DNA-processing protein DprA n=1 Tax=Actinomycetospora soli TaxID=2893887 RepID=UPI001E2D2BF5|nr:DNA-processing protein DprA [Actinomycetospora soli]MCD2191709.1 DNA-protecting protein DprA [Actinomycetospora soli]
MTTHTTSPNTGGTPAAPRIPASDAVRYARALLARMCRGVANPEVAALVAEFGPVAAVAEVCDDPRRARLFYGATVAAGDRDRAAADLATAAALGARFLVPEDPGFPERAVMGWTRPDGALTVSAPVLGLWVRGDAPLTGGRRLVVTGSRAASAYGLHVARDWAAQLTESGVRIVTGGALGIEGEALRGALSTAATPRRVGAGDAAGAPVVVLPGGIDRMFPAAHAPLFEAVTEQGGALVTPYLPGTLPSRAMMLGRLRLMAGLGTSGTLIVEAAARSSSQHAACDARDHGFPVLAVPGPVTSETSVGAHRLAREPWARLVGSVDDVHGEITTAEQRAALEAGASGAAPASDQ